MFKGDTFELGIARAEPGLGPDRALRGLGPAVLPPTSPENPFSLKKDPYLSKIHQYLAEI